MNKERKREKWSTMYLKCPFSEEQLNVDVIVYFDEPEVGKKKVVRQDTLEVVAITELTPEDRQELLFDGEN